MTTQDELWKAIIEELLDSFMAFFFEKYYGQIDQSRPYEVMDKELSKIYPETTEKRRRADKLIKVPLKNKPDFFVLIHTEVQGYREENYGRRMYVCQYRIDERFGLPVAALVIYSDRNQQNRKNSYRRSFFGTELSYRFPTYVIDDHTFEEYDQMHNPFAIICQTVLLALENNIADEELLEMKVTLFRKLLKKDYSKKQIRLITIFIKEYARFGKKDFYLKFDNQIDEITENNKNMSLEETVIAIRSREAVAEATEKGMEKGMEKGIEKNQAISEYTNILKCFIKKPNWTVADIADFFETDETKIQKLKAILNIPTQKKMKTEINKLFFKKIDLEEKDWEKIIQLAKTYRNGLKMN